ncbi:molybdopterin-binding protein, partial [Planktomarina sp.]|nr:molybdopterin-binding protein [Planktomarina sp.]
MVKTDPIEKFVPVKIALLTVSDTRSLDEDKSGDILEARVKDAGHILVAREILQDDRFAIVSTLNRWVADKSVDVVISTGGTGLTGRDVTVEAHRDVYEKEIDAFGA